MRVVAFIPPDKRNNYRCFFCGETRSVKYVMEIYDPVIDSKPTRVCSCNLCVLKQTLMT